MRRDGSPYVSATIFSRFYPPGLLAATAWRDVAGTFGYLLAIVTAGYLGLREGYGPTGLWLLAFVLLSFGASLLVGALMGHLWLLAAPLLPLAFLLLAPAWAWQTLGVTDPMVGFMFVGTFVGEEIFVAAGVVINRHLRAAGYGLTDGTQRGPRPS